MEQSIASHEAWILLGHVLCTARQGRSRESKAAVVVSEGFHMLGPGVRSWYQGHVALASQTFAANDRQNQSWSAGTPG